jgi:hypothetical protein
VIKEVRKADSFFDQGKAEFEKKSYEAALNYFQGAQKIYLDVGSERAAECDEWIQKIQTGTESIPEYGLTILVGVLAGILICYFIKRRG